MSNDTVIVTLQQVAIQRSSEVTITDSFFAHELPILELIHGEDNVTVLNDDYHAIELPNNGAQEYQRLVTKYGDKYRPIIDQVFPRGIADVSKELGMVQGRDTFSKQSEAVIDSRLPARPTKAGTPKDANPDGDEEVEELSHTKLREELTRLGIEHKGNAPKADLQALYDAAQAGAGDTLGG